jgi:hypothetical protein
MWGLDRFAEMTGTGWQLTRVLYAAGLMVFILVAMASPRSGTLRKDPSEKDEEE